jgi:pilus assembly protein CpaE
LFGTAANNGQMIAELLANHRTSKMFLDIAHKLTGLTDTRKPKRSFLTPIIKKLSARSKRA